MQSVLIVFQHHLDVREASIVARQSSQSVYVLTFSGRETLQPSWPAAAAQNHDGMPNFGKMID